MLTAQISVPLAPTPTCLTAIAFPPPVAANQRRRNCSTPPPPTSLHTLKPWRRGRGQRSNRSSPGAPTPAPGSVQVCLPKRLNSLHTKRKQKKRENGLNCSLLCSAAMTKHSLLLRLPRHIFPAGDSRLDWLLTGAPFVTVTPPVTCFWRPGRGSGVDTGDTAGRNGC